MDGSPPEIVPIDEALNPASTLEAPSALTYTQAMEFLDTIPGVGRQEAESSWPRLALI